MASPVKDTAWLDWMAGLMGATPRPIHAARLAAGRFHCLLDELPLHLIPRRVLDSQPGRQDLSQPLFLNPECALLSAGRLPLELESHRDLLAGFSLDSTVAWVRDPATRGLQPFWLGPELEAVVRRLEVGSPAPAAIPHRARRLLAEAGILTPAGSVERRLSEWSEIVSQSGPRFRQRGYVALGNLIHPFHLAALRRYYRCAIRRGAIRLGDEQSPRRYVAHNEKVARFFHHQIASAVTDIAGEAVKPSYVYLASYLGGAELKKHTDRLQCEFSVTWCLDFSPEPDLATSWPIRLESAEGTVTVYQGLGDGLAYRGTRLPHSRDVLGAGRSSTSIFFHYVPSSFSGPLD